MPGRLFLETNASELAAQFGAVATDLDLAPRYNIAPGQDVVTLRPDGFEMMRWGMIPVGRVNARGRPVLETIVNARSETVFEKSAFADVRRCLVPAHGWYEWTGEKRRKTPWRIRPTQGGLLAFAAICDLWQGPGGVTLWQVATVTCEPSPDVVDIHDRMGVLLEPADFSAWLSGSTDDAKALCRPTPPGYLTVEPAEGVDWAGA